MLFVSALDESSGHEWHTRYSIMKGICKGLKYLHEDSVPAIFHLDLKPANVLLDEKWLPKIADFGLSRLIGEERTYITTGPTGTM
jgi:serine/threonine protein kinase